MAAAYAALVSLFNNLELIQTHPRHSFSFDSKQIQSLLQIVCFLIDFMGTGDYNKGAAEVLERLIASAAHAAEDVIETHVVDQIRAGSTLDGKKRSCFLPDVQKVIEDMEFMRRKAIRVQKMQSEFKAKQPIFSAATSSTPLTTEKDKMVGFDDVLLRLLDWLTGYPSSRRVIPIVGTGGIGKTTLAKNAFKHKLIVEHFDVCLWVAISQQYVVSDILSKLIFGHGESNCETIDKLGVQLHKRLIGKRYLIVLDDMWSVRAWDEIKLFFPDTRCGSRIIVTTRQSDVADCLDSSCLAMSFLEEDESWDLFCEKAFAEQGCPSELEDIGKRIVGKCGGLPLALVVVGGYLRMSPWTQEYWGNVANQMSSVLNSRENGEQVFDILYLSYSHLPVHLKPCFLYLGVFPENKRIPAKFLIRLWIAEGFLKPKQGKTLEEVAEGCLHDLIARSLILVSKSSWILGEVEYCGIHDVLRDLCLRLVEKENFFGALDSTTQSMDRERRIVINMEEKKMQHVQKSTPLLRTLITWKGCHVSFNSKLLRVGINKDEDAPVENFRGCKFINSRFLEYGIKNKRSLFEMNSSISLLWNLQALSVKRGTIASYEIWEMTQLRYLKCFGIVLPDPLPSDETNGMVMQNLQTLKGVVNLRLSDEVCERIPNIKKLTMQYSDDEAWSYCPHNLGRLHKLESLDCVLDIGPVWHEFAQALTFPRSLKKLFLASLHLDWEEITVKIGCLPLLEVLVLKEVNGGAEWNPIAGRFPRLRILYIWDCPDLRNWNAESSHFPALEHLNLKGLSMLEEFPCTIGEIPTLQRINSIDNDTRLNISALRTVVEQEDNGNDTLHLYVYFLINWDKAMSLKIVQEESFYFWNDRDKTESFKKIVEEEGLTTNNLHLGLTF